MKKLIVLFLLICSPCFAQDSLKDKVGVLEESGKTFFKDSHGTKYESEDVPLISAFVLKKPVIDNNKILSEDESGVVEFSLKENGRRLIMNELIPAKNDYKNDFDRGTVYYTPKSKNYSFHKVIVPDGTVVSNSNFTQKEPFSRAISGKNLTFINCNLVNVMLDTTWVLNGGNYSQIKRTKKSEKALEGGFTKIVISHKVYQNGVFVEVGEDEEVTTNTDDYNLVHLRLNAE